MSSTSFYLGLALLFTYEMDSLPNHEWRVLPLLRLLSESAGETVFILAHIPIFALTIACVASLDSRARKLARDIACGFFIVRALLRTLLSKHPAYEFSSLLSSVLIYGAATPGVAFSSAAVLRVDGDRA